MSVRSNEIGMFSYGHPNPWLILVKMHWAMWSVASPGPTHLLRWAPMGRAAGAPQNGCVFLTFTLPPSSTASMGKPGGVAGSRRPILLPGRDLNPSPWPVRRPPVIWSLAMPPALSPPRAPRTSGVVHTFPASEGRFLLVLRTEQPASLFSFPRTR